MKNIPDTWIDEIVNGLKQNPSLFKYSFNKDPIKDIEYYTVVNEFLHHPFNVDWQIDIKKYGDKFKPFFISICIHQCMHNMHPLTCCSNHEILMPRISFKGDCYLVCPTCGWIQPQEYVPFMFGKTNEY
jgi:hypothetical protein